MDDQHSPSARSFVEVVRALPVIACVVGPDGEVLVTNEAWRAFGEANDNPYPASEGENYIDVCRQVDGDPYATEVADALEQLLAGEMEMYRTAYPCPGPDVERWFDLLACRMELEGGPFVLMYHIDATSRTQAELETTAEVERLEALARVLSHDLRTPLSVASGYVRLLEDEVDSPHLERVEEALERIATIAENAVLIARGTDIDETEPVDIHALAERVWGTLDTKGASLFVDDGVTVEGDPGLLSELLENLFRNALDHAGDDPTVLVGGLEGGSGFYVADDGPGIPDEVREEVFEIGYTTGAGTGFGLDIVKRIAQAHGWVVRVGERDEGGARFELIVSERAEDGCGEGEERGGEAMED